MRLERGRGGEREEGKKRDMIEEEERERVGKGGIQKRKE